MAARVLRHQLLNISGRRLVGAVKGQLTVRALRIAAVENENVKVDVETERRSEALHDGDRTGLTRTETLARQIVANPPEDLRCRDAEHAANQPGVTGEEKPTAPWRGAPDNPSLDWGGPEAPCGSACGDEAIG